MLKMEEITKNKLKEFIKYLKMTIKAAIFHIVCLDIIGYI